MSAAKLATNVVEETTNGESAFPTFDINLLAVTLPAPILPDTVKLDNVPVLVIFGCATVVNVPVNKVPETFPAAIFAVTVKSPGIATAPVVLLKVNPVLPWKTVV